MDNPGGNVDFEVRGAACDGAVGAVADLCAGLVRAALADRPRRTAVHSRTAWTAPAVQSPMVALCQRRLAGSLCLSESSEFRALPAARGVVHT